MLNSHVADLIAANKGCEFLFCGCSDGSEIFDIFMSLANAFFMNNIPLKYLPKFKAFDISEQMVNIAKNGRINISNAGIDYIEKNYPKLNFFINKGKLVHHENDNIEELEGKICSKVRYSYQFQPGFLEKIEFYQGDMLEEFSKITPDICRIIFCRNVARYNSTGDQEKAAKLLDRNLKCDSLVVVGFCDEHNPIDNDKKLQRFNRKNLFACPRLPFTETLFNSQFKHDKTISPDGLVYKKS